MALVLKDRVKGWTDSYGEDNFVIFATTNGYQSFSVIGNGNQTYYTVFDPTNYDWEVGIGTYTAATTTLSRDTILSSSNNNLIVSFLPGTKELFVGYPAEKAVTLDTPQTITDKTLVNATVTSGTINNTTIGATTPASGAFTTLVASGASLTSVNAGVALLTSATVTTLNATSVSIASANVGNLQGVGASIGSINAGVAVVTNLTATGASVASINAGVALFTNATTTTLNATGASIASANIGNLQFTAASIASINAGIAVITNLTATSASIASMNAGVALLTNATVTTLNATGASIASANIGNLQFTAASIASINAGVAVITNLTATGASIASANVGTAVITTGTVTNLTSTSASVASINAAVALITTGTVTALTATGASVASANVGTAVVTGLTVTNASIASLNAGTATVTTGNLTFSSTSQRITGDFSNATIANRVMFQCSVANTNTPVNAIPNGTATGAGFRGYGASDPTNAPSVSIFQVGTTDSRIGAEVNGTASYTPMTFYTGGSERMRLDTSGNLLVGTATSVGGVRLTSVGGGVQLSGGTTAQEGVRIQRATGYATFTGINNDNNAYNGLQFFTGASAAATIDTSGNVGIGTTTIGAGGTATRLQVANANTASVGTQANLMVTTTDAQAANVGGIIGLGGSVTTASPTANMRLFGAIRGAKDDATDGGTNGYMAFYTMPSSSVTATERMRIDSSGNVGIGGTASAFAKVHALGTLPSSSNATQVFRASGEIPSGTTSTAEMFVTVPSTQAASFTLTHLRHYVAVQDTIGAGSTVTNQVGFRVSNTLTGATNNYGFYSDIASGSNRWNFYANGTAQNYFAGNVRVGTTSNLFNSESAEKLTVTNSSGQAASFRADAAGGYPVCYFWQRQTGSQNIHIFYSGTTPTAVGSITTDGTNTAFNTSSDYRLKNQISFVDNALSSILKIKVRKWVWKSSGKTDSGFIAHELQEIAPNCVFGEKDGVKENGEPIYQGVDPSKLVHLLVKAMQEQQDQIKELQDKVAELEAK